MHFHVQYQQVEVWKFPNYSFRVENGVQVEFCGHRYMIMVHKLLLAYITNVLEEGIREFSQLKGKKGLKLIVLQYLLRKSNCIY